MKIEIAWDAIADDATREALQPAIEDGLALGELLPARIEAWAELHPDAPQAARIAFLNALITSLGVHLVGNVGKHIAAKIAQDLERIVEAAASKPGTIVTVVDKGGDVGMGIVSTEATRQ